MIEPSVRRAGTTSRRPVERISVGEAGVQRRVHRDTLATEEPLEIRVVVAGGSASEAHRVSVTMRTPGADAELAAGFLFGEGLIHVPQQVAAIRPCVDRSRSEAQRGNVVNVFLAEGVAWDPGLVQRNFYATSSCGVCGKASIEAVIGPACAWVGGSAAVGVDTLLALPDALGATQTVFRRTGGLHAAALFTAGGTLLRVREDVGRHNAMDKLIGAALLAGELPLRDYVALMSGRLSFELVQKAARAGVSTLAGISAPSSLAIELAEEVGMTLIGFLREGRFNVYTGGERISSAGGNG